MEHVADVRAFAICAERIAEDQARRGREVALVSDEEAAVLHDEIGHRERGAVADLDDAVFKVKTIDRDLRVAVDQHVDRTVLRHVDLHGIECVFAANEVDLSGGGVAREFDFRHLEVAADLTDGALFELIFAFGVREPEASVDLSELRGVFKDRAAFTDVDVARLDRAAVAHHCVLDFEGGGRDGGACGVHEGRVRQSECTLEGKRAVVRDGAARNVEIVADLAPGILAEDKRVGLADREGRLDSSRKGAVHHGVAVEGGVRENEDGILSRFEQAVDRHGLVGRDRAFGLEGRGARQGRLANELDGRILACKDGGVFTFVRDGLDNDLRIVGSENHMGAAVGLDWRLEP